MVRFVKGDVEGGHRSRVLQGGRARGPLRRGDGRDRAGDAPRRGAGWRDGGPDGHPHFEYRRQSIFPNNYYFYIRDPDWGPGFLKTAAYAPYPVWLYLNGNEWAKRQADPARDRVHAAG